MSPRRLFLAAALVAAVIGLVPTAHADGDPASDVLYFDWLFVPFTTHRSPEQDALAKTIRAARKAGYPIKVAIISNPTDLGTVPQLFGKPGLYARFLGQELRFVSYGNRLLIAMPNGFGIFHYGKPTTKEEKALEGVAIDASGVDGLAASATEAVHRLAALEGHQLPVFAVPKASSGSSPWLWIGIGVGVAAVVAIAAGAAVLLRRRRVEA